MILMNTPRARRALGSAIVVVTAGSLLHFAWSWSGRSPFVAIFAATNESTWEHLKMAFWPALLISPIQRWLYGALPGWLVGTAIRVLMPPVLIVALFYGYTSVLGTNHLVLDIGTFVVAVMAGEFAGHSAMHERTAAGVRRLAASALVAAILAFSTLSFSPPRWFLFDDPLDGGDDGAAPAEDRQHRIHQLHAPFPSPALATDMIRPADPLRT